MKTANREENEFRQRLFDSFLTCVLKTKEESIKYKRGELALNVLPHIQPVSEQPRILEIGPGRGELLTLLRERGYENVVAVDVGKEPVDFCINMGTGYDIRIRTGTGGNSMLISELRGKSAFEFPDIIPFRHPALIESTLHVLPGSITDY